MQNEQPSGNAIAALVLGIVGIFLFQLCAPFAIWLGKREMDAIRNGESPQAGHGYAVAGIVLGIIGSCFLLLGLCCLAGYVLMIVGVIASVPLAGGAMQNLAPLTAQQELLRLSRAQQSFYQQDLDGDGRQDYATSFAELRNTGAFANGGAAPSASGYRFDMQSDGTSWSARAVPLGTRHVERYFIDQSGTLRQTADGTLPGPNSSAVVDEEYIPEAEEDPWDESADDETGIDAPPAEVDKSTPPPAEGGNSDTKK